VHWLLAQSIEQNKDFTNPWKPDYSVAMVAILRKFYEAIKLVKQRPKDEGEAID